MKRPSEKVVSYITGLFDGEGYVGACFDRKGCIHFSVEISNTHLGVLRFVMKSLDAGKISVRTHKNEIRMNCFKWSPRNRWEMVKFLEMISPYSLIKKNQIGLTLELLSTVRNAVTNPRTPIPDGLRERRKEMVKELKAMKRTDYGDFEDMTQFPEYPNNFDSPKPDEG